MNAYLELNLADYMPTYGYWLKRLVQGRSNSFHDCSATSLLQFTYERAPRFGPCLAISLATLVHCLCNFCNVFFLDQSV